MLGFVCMYAELRIVHALHGEEACVGCAMLHRSALSRWAIVGNSTSTFTHQRTWNLFFGGCVASQDVAMVMQDWLYQCCQPPMFNFCTGRLILLSLAYLCMQPCQGRIQLSIKRGRGVTMADPELWNSIWTFEVLVLQNGCSLRNFSGIQGPFIIHLRICMCACTLGHQHSL